MPGEYPWWCHYPNFKAANPDCSCDAHGPAVASQVASNSVAPSSNIQGLTWATPVRIDLLAAQLEAFGKAADVIEELRFCRRVGNGKLHGVVVPQEIILRIENAVRAQIPAWFHEIIPRVHAAYHCAHCTCTPEDHLFGSGVLEKYAPDVHRRFYRVPGQCRGNDDDHYKHLIGGIMGLGLFNNNPGDEAGADDKAVDADHNRKIKEWKNLTDQKLGGRFNKCDQTLYKLFGLGAFIVNESVFSFLDPSEHKHMTHDPPMATYAYLYLPTNFCSLSVTQMRHPDGEERKGSGYASNDGARYTKPDSFSMCGAAVVSPEVLQPLSPVNKRKFTTAMTQMGLKPFVHPMQFRQTLRGVQPGAKKSVDAMITNAHLMECMEWPQRMILSKASM